MNQVEMQKTVTEITFGEWLKRRRLALGLTQEQLAQQIHCSTSALRKFESEQRLPSTQIVNQFAEIFDISQDERPKFLRFARGDWTAMPGRNIQAEPWQARSAPTHTSLPTPLTSFIGREKEVEAVIQAVNENRLVTLTGPGGVGKTRLAIQAAQKMETAFKNGVCWVDLAPLTTEGHLPQAFASALGVREIRGRSLEEAISNYLHARQILLVVDNCEHLVAACARLADRLLNACPHLKILATSREALGLTHEVAWPVPPLSLPDQKLAPVLDLLLQAEGIRLFIERASLVSSDFALTEQNAAAVTQVCQRLDGLPLAIELAAARVRMMSPAEIAAGLGGRMDDGVGGANAVGFTNRFHLLTTGSRAAMPRHQTLRAALAWSYDLLSPAEQILFQRLSVFTSGFTLKAVEEIRAGGEISKSEVIHLIGQLINKSLVQIIRRLENTNTRYGMLETIQQYAWEKLSETGKAESIKALHLHYYLQLALEAEPELEGSRMLDALSQLDPELDNIRAALEWGMDRHPATALQLATALNYFWSGHGLVTEGRQWVSRILQGFDTSATPEHPIEWQALRAKALWSLGSLAFAEGELNAAFSLCTESARLARAAKEPKILVDALTMLGFAATWLGDAATAETCIEEGLRVARTNHYPLGTASILQVQASDSAMLRRDFPAAKAYAEESVRWMRKYGSPYLTATAVKSLGNIAYFQGNYPEALAHFQACERLFLDLGDRPMATGAQSDCAHAERMLGHFEQAEIIYHQTILAWQELGNSVALAHDLECLAFIACSKSQWLRAACLLGAAESMRSSLDAPMTTNEQTEYGQNVSVLRSQMDQTTLAKAWAEGRSMTIEQAVVSALGSKTEPRPLQ